ncbi:unnamed protein product [Mesocestoides corti]|uniref:Uncharacterized protein n=1 Tax=Mesocestoides corti TaxID=53468 RepID=A0A158QTS1_MESCO|nr:unnamed protein product [Mesocestoides corti]
MRESVIPIVKSQISGVAAFGNTSSLLVTFDKVSERLLPQPPLPSTGNTKPRRFFAQGALSHGFMDTNDERLQLLHQARRVKPKSKPRPQATVEEKKAVATVGEQADQPNVFPKAQTTISPKLETTDPTKSAIDPEAQKAERRKRRREERNRGKPGRRRRDKRSSFFYYPISKDPIPGQNMLLECAGCSLQLPTSPMAPNSATRWLVMAKSLEKSRINGTVGAPNLQAREMNNCDKIRSCATLGTITSLMPWQKDTPGFRDALRDIRNIPRAILCNPNTKVELNFDGFQRSEQTTPPPFPQRYPIRTSWSRQGWAPWQRTPNPTWNLPSPFEGLFQNDAGSAAASAGNREKKKRRRQMQRRRKNQTKNTNQRTGDAKKLREEERRLRRKARKERLARMTPAQRMAWTARRRARRARRKELESRRRLQQRPHNLTNGTNSSLL